jgi:hypothetical protein
MIKMKRTEKGYKIQGIEYTIEEAMQIADWIIDQWDHLIRYESVMLMTHENADMIKKGTRVYVEWWDIVADLHTENDIEPAVAQSVGWIDSYTKKYLRLFTTKYKDTIQLADKIVIPVGCIKSIQEI